ncbi:MAG: MFS transporter [Caldisphaera sp.]
MAGASIGNVLEWYDFGIYAFFAVIISRTIFGSSSVSALLLTFLAYGLGFIFRPLGSIFFGWYGDLKGRKSALLLTFWIMGIGTILTGIIPPFVLIGIGAPILITIARLVQGFGAGGEWGGAGVYLTELGGKNKRGIYGSLQQEFVLGSVLIAIISALIIDTFPNSFVYSIGWRIPFIVGGILIIPLAYYLRRKMPETEYFEQVKKDKKLAVNPIKKAFTKDIKPMLIVLFGTAAVTAQFYVLVTYMSSYVATYTHLGLMFGLIISATIEAFMMPSILIFGYLSDKWKTRKKLFWIGTLVLGLIVYPEFLLIRSGDIVLIIAISIILGVLEGIGAGTLVAFIGEQFPTNDRYSGYIGYNLAASYFGGFGPFISMALILMLNNTMAPALWVIAVTIMSLIILLFSKETAHIDTLPEDVSLYERRMSETTMK